MPSIQNTEIGTRAAQKDIYVKQGSDWFAKFKIQNPDKTFVDLTGSSFSGKVRRNKLSSVVEAQFTFSVNTVTREVSVTLSKTISSAMKAGEKESDMLSKYVYDWEWTKPNGEVDRFQEGSFILSAEVTK
jgi:hypothetical protein